MNQDNVIAHRYRIENLLGEGGMGQVFRAYDQTLGRPVAIKLLSQTASDQAMKRFHQEAKALAALKHPNIMPVLDFGQTDEGRLFLVLELIEGETLSDVIEKRGAQRFLDAMPTLEKVSDALRFAHNQKILHRDVKPSNVLLAVDGSRSIRVLLSDFGLAKQIDKNLTLTSKGTTMGTPAYMSPEAVLGKDIDERSDIYSLGCLMYEVLAGRPPFQGETMLTSMMAHVHQTPPALSQLCQYPVAPELDAFLARCLSKEPDERFQTVSELIDDMQRIKSHMVGHVSAGDSSDGWARSGVYFTKLGTMSRAPYIVAMLAVAFVVCIGTYVVWLLAPNKTPPDQVSRKHKKTKSRKADKKKVVSRVPGVYILKDSNDASYPLFAGSLSDAEVESELAKYPHYVGRVAFEEAQLSDVILKRLLVNQKLQAATFFKTPVGDKTFQYLTGASNLAFLSIDTCGALPPDNLRRLAKLRHLQILEVDLKEGVAGSVEAISEIQSLFRLRLQNWCLTDSDVIALSGLGNLRRLDFKSCTVTSKILAELKQIPQCNSIGFHNTSLDEEQMETIAKIPGLVSLTLDNTQVSDAGFLKLVKARKLRILEVGNTGVSEKSAELLRKLLPGLEYFTFNEAQAPLQEPEKI